MPSASLACCQWFIRLLLAFGAVLSNPIHAAAGAPAAGIYRLDVAFDLARSRLMGVAEIQPARPGRLKVDLGDLEILAVEADGRAVALPAEADAPLLVNVRKRLHIRYEADYPAADKEQISPAGIALAGEWYPVVHGSYRYRLRAVLPTGWQAVSEADTVRRVAVAGGVRHEFLLRHALPHQDGISLMASDRFVVTQRKYRDIDLAAFFLPEDAHHAQRFLDKAVEYLARFERQLGPYPYQRLSLVEHLHGGAHSLPGYIVLTPDNLRAEEWEDTSLDHEIAHQWFGNLVFTDYGSGNWNEGLTIYVADYLSSEAAGRGWECRRRILAGYGNNIPAGKAYPLAAFEEKEDRASRSIGYGKSAMVFHMLRRDLGDARFFAGLRRFVEQHRFRVASWHDIRKSFEIAAGCPLDAFFAQWVWRAETPKLDIAAVATRQTAAGVVVELTVTQETQGTPAFRMRLPVTWRFADGRRVSETVTLNGPRTVLRRRFAESPVEIALDEEFDVFRSLQDAEYPPTIERLLTRERIRYITDKTLPSYYQPVIKRLAALDGEVMGMRVDDMGTRPGRSARKRPAGAASARSWQATDAAGIESATASGTQPDSVLVLDRSNPMLARLFPEPPPAAGDFEVSVAPHPRDARRLVGLIHAESAAAVGAALDAMPNLWCVSRVVLKEGRVIEKTVAETPRGIRRMLSP